MRLVRLLLLSALALGLPACAVLERSRKLPPPPVAVSLPPTNADRWMGVASAADAERLRRLPEAWAEGLRQVRTARLTTALREEGELVSPDAALARPAPTPGSYNCRMVRLGKASRSGRAFERFRPFFCYVEVEGDLLTIVKQTGSERPAGRLWEDDQSSRLIFLGSVALGNEEQTKAYGQDPSRDMAGVLERVAPMRWRLVIPYPRSGAPLELFELTPVAEQPRT